MIRRYWVRFLDWLFPWNRESREIAERLDGIPSLSRSPEPCQHPSFRFLGSPAFAKQCIVCGFVVYFDNMPDGVYEYTEVLRTAVHNPVDAVMRYVSKVQQRAQCTHYCLDCGRGVPVESLTKPEGCPYCGSKRFQEGLAV